MENRVYDFIGESVFCAETENGLKVFVIKKPGYSKKYAYFATNYGGADVRFKYKGKFIATPAGVAHFLEHKMFDMPDGNALNILSENGASPNAYTSLDITAYHFESVENFEENLKILLDFVSTPYFTEDSVKKEQGIIGQEIGMTYDNPSTEMYYGFLKCLYRDNPIRNNIVGSVESISKITPQVLNRCHNVFYNPKNMALCIVGDVDEERVLDIVKSQITAPAGVVPERDYGSEEELLPFNCHFEKEMPVAAPIFLAGCKCSIAGGGREHLRRLLLGQLSLNLFIGTSSPLYSKLYAQGLINSSFFAEIEATANTAHIAFGGESVDYEKVIDAVISEAKNIAENGFEQEYFVRSVKAMIGDEIRSLNGFDNICYNVAKGCFKGYDPFESVNIIREIKNEETAKFIKEHFTEEMLASSVICPFKK